MSSNDTGKPTNEVSRITEEFRRAWDGNAWHGPPIAPLLASIEDPTARYLPAGGAHTIHDLATHIIFWLDVALRRLQGEHYLPESGDWYLPPDEKWDQTVGRLERKYVELLAAIEATPDSRLAETVSGMEYNVYVLLHGVLQHTIYHAGQIAMLRRLATSGGP